MSVPKNIAVGGFKMGKFCYCNCSYHGDHLLPTGLPCLLTLDTSVQNACFILHNLKRKKAFVVYKYTYYYITNKT